MHWYEVVLKCLDEGFLRNYFFLLFGHINTKTGIKLSKIFLNIQVALYLKMFRLHLIFHFSCHSSIKMLIRVNNYSFQKVFVTVKIYYVMILLVFYQYFHDFAKNWKLGFFSNFFPNIFTLLGWAGEGWGGANPGINGSGEAVSLCPGKC